MYKKQYFERGGLLTGTGSFIAAIPALTRVPGPGTIATLFTYSGLGIGVIGVAMILIPFIPKWQENYPTVRRVGRNDLKRAYIFCGGVFGDNFSSFNSVKKWFRHNNKMFWLVEKVKHNGPVKVSVITGFFSVLPLTQEGVDMLLDGQIDGTHFTTKHIALNFNTPVAYYVGAIGSKGGKSKGVALGALTERMSAFLETYPAPIYARPTTRDGLRIARQYFEAVDGSGTRDMNKLYVRETNVL
ncbi:MAG: hypothetical protein V3U75_13880 [Methylococcaceae bacterium]